jgi:hypothetical protein
MNISLDVPVLLPMEIYSFGLMQASIPSFRYVAWSRRRRRRRERERTIALKN